GDRGVGSRRRIGRSSDQEDPLGVPEALLRGREQLTPPPPLAPVARRAGLPVADSPPLRPCQDLARGRPAPVDDHLYPIVPLVTVAEVLVEHGSVPPHDDEPAGECRPVGHYSITSSARASTEGGIVRPRVLAVLSRAGRDTAAQVSEDDLRYREAAHFGRLASSATRATAARSFDLFPDRRG